MRRHDKRLTSRGHDLSVPVEWRFKCARTRVLQGVRGMTRRLETGRKLPIGNVAKTILAANGNEPAANPF
jgi:hypothetical protein